MSATVAGGGLRPTRPALRYHGGKWRLAPWIVSMMPPHNIYVEPFGGAASVLLCKDAARIEVYNDLDQTVVGLFRVLRDPQKAEALRRLLELTPFSRAEFESCWTVSDDPVEEARRLVVRSFQALGNKDRLHRNGWRTRTAKAVWSPCVTWAGWPEQIPLFCARLRDTIIECRPWQQVIDLYDSTDALLYLDPPYVLDTRAQGHRKIYANEMTDEDHAELLARVQTVKSAVILSGYRHPMYDAALKGWTRLDKHARAQHNRARVETVWLNPRAAEHTMQHELGLAACPAT